MGSMTLIFFIDLLVEIDRLVVQFPAKGSTQVLLCPYPGVLWL